MTVVNYIMRNFTPLSVILSVCLHIGYRGEVGGVYSVQGETRKKDNLENLDEDGRIILKFVLK
jgi:hypothetical protein